MQHQYRQEKQMQQMQMSDKPLIKSDNKMYRVQNPVRSELSLNVFFLFKGLISRNIQKTAKSYPKINIIFGKAGGSWWKPEYRIIVGGKTKKEVQAAAELLQKKLNGGKK